MNIKTHSSNEKERFVHIEEDEKKELFAGTANENSHGLSLMNLIGVLVFGGAFLALLAPKIYLSNNIYYISRKINTIEYQKRLLLEEQQILKNELEKERFKYYIENSENIGDIAF
ncbi:hypothetical protein KVC53_03575 [Helicobacter pylori]|uniref:hypothetical protein n=1 Tax=Helicobacter pylori TaxID=210 RepID=UPI000D3BE1A8|nr:hypothetical protein [Helicobacter pylori]PUD24794.1 hypothetical protein C2S44_02310 [Helicobacter pylori]WQS10074.1 hypothetical protein KVC53_03575 [Helicobacter pylori]